MIDIKKFISNFPNWLIASNEEPWAIVNNLDFIIEKQLESLNNDYILENGMAIHKTAVVENGFVFKGKIIISENCFIGANAYLREPIFIDKSVKIEPSSEIKQSVILENSAIAHFNYIGNSIIGKNTNFEAGSVCANHYNERQNKNIFVFYEGNIIVTKSIKFGALIGDNSKIGANAVLSPGTILEKNSIVKRLELIEQLK